MYKSLLSMLMWDMLSWAAFVTRQHRPDKAQAKQTFCCGRKHHFRTDCRLTSSSALKATL